MFHRVLGVLCAVGLSGCTASGGLNFSLNGSTEASGGAQASGSAAALSGGPTRQFTERMPYKITQTVDGKELALTYLVAPGPHPDCLVCEPSKQKVVLQPYTGDVSQKWLMLSGGVNSGLPGDSYLIYVAMKLPAQAESNGVLKVYEPNRAFVPTAEEREKYNRLTVGLSQGYMDEYWVVNKRADGTFSLTSHYSVKEALNVPGGQDRKDRWDEARSLELATDLGAPSLTHGPSSLSNPRQGWRITEAPR